MFKLRCKACETFVLVSYPMQPISCKCGLAFDRDYIIDAKMEYGVAEFERMSSSLTFAFGCFVLWLVGSFGLVGIWGPQHTEKWVPWVAFLCVAAFVLAAAQGARLSHRMAHRLSGYMRLPEAD